MNVVVAQTTADDETVADKLASGIIENKLGACVEIMKIKTTYKWEGKINKADEFLIVIKTISEKIEALKEFIIKNHTYDLPEFLVFPVLAGSTDYLDWVRAELEE